MFFVAFFIFKRLGLDISHLKKRLLRPAQRRRLRSTDRPLAVRGVKLGGEKMKKAPTVDDCGALVTSPLRGGRFGGKTGPMEDLVGGGRSLGNRHIRGADRFGS
jgi:hypothetical protein